MLDALIQVPGALVGNHPALTRRRHLKDLVRARMARTGESYSTARAHLARRSKAKVRGNPMIIVPVSDTDRAANFYAVALGLAVRSASPTWTTLGDDSQVVALEPAPDTGVDLGIGIKVADLPAALDGVVAAGGRIESSDERVARVTDPDGNTVRLMAFGEPTS